MSEVTTTKQGWRGTDYTPQATHHRELDDWFLARHTPDRNDVVVDAGCGTGEFTIRLASLVPDGSVIGVEPNPSMLHEAQTKTANKVEFREGHVQDLDAVCTPESADLVVSRAVFHWIPLAEYERCFTAVRRVLKPTGWFHAESGATGNVRHVVALLDEIAQALGLGRAAVSFPDAGTVMEMLERAGFSIPDGGVSTVAQRRTFDRATLTGFLHTQAMWAWVPDDDAEVQAAFLNEVDTRIDDLRRHDGTYDQTFVRLHVLAQRPRDLNDSRTTRRRRTG